jgi:hypothetical protein
MTRIIIAYCLLLITVETNSQQLLNIHFKHKVGNNKLKLFDETYTNSFNEPFTVNKFKYYISNIIVTSVNGKSQAIKDKYFLINEADSFSKVIQIKSSFSEIKTIEFLIGVDSIKNISGVQTGALDPMNGMFWTWNTGYVFAKLEGQSDSAHAPNHAFTYDVGGFRAHEKALRKVVLHINSNSSNNITINVDVLKWFNAKHDIKISSNPFCHQAGTLAMQLADNYSTMFSIEP